MANGGQLPGTASLYDNTIYDERGNVIFKTVTGQYLIHEPDGSMTSRSEGSTIELVDGTQWSPAQAAMKDNPIRVGVCQLCREPPYQFPFRAKPRHGIVSLRRAKRCAGSGCGRLLCPQHRKMGSDGRWRCTVCARRHWWRMLVLRLFFSFEEDNQ